MITEYKYLKYRKIHKQRRLKLFYMYYKNSAGVQLIAKQNIKFFTLHLRVFKNLLKRSYQKLSIITRKEKFKSGGGQLNLYLNKIKRYDLVMRKYKNVFFYLSWNQLVQIDFSTFTLSTFKKRLSIYINLMWLPFTRKAIGTRMGKGTGSLQTWYMNIKSGMPVLSFYYWPLVKLLYLLKQLQCVLPGQWFISYSFFGNRLNRHYLMSTYNFLC